MSASVPQVPVFAWRNANSYPDPQNKVKVDLMTLGEALDRAYRTDAHFSAYTTPLERRLNNHAVGRTPIAMVYLVADIDDPVAHRLGIDARDEWRAEMEAKIGKLREAHPGVVIYGTLGGYRLIFGCEPFPIETPEDARAWWNVYGRFVGYLRAGFQIVADPKCKDFGRLYRLPRVWRNGVQLDGPLGGDPHNIEVLHVSKLPALKTPHPFVAAAVKKAVQNVRTAKNGARNDTLNKEAFGLGGFVASGYLDETEVTDALVDAIVDHNDGDAEKDSRKVVSAIAAGMKHPRQPPEQASTASGASRAKRAPAAGAAAPDNKGEPSPERDELHLDGRPLIWITHEIFTMTKQASEALRPDPTLFKRDCDLVHVTRIDREEAERSRLIDTDEGPRHELVEGTPRIRKITFALLKSRLSALVQWVGADRKGKKKAMRPDGDVTAALLEAGEWPTVRELVGIVEAPFIRPNGSVAQTPGYDAVTGRLYVPSIDFPEVPERPTQKQAAAALAELTDLFVDFPHENPAHKMVPVAHLLTLLGRPAIWGSTPAFIYDANARGSGKSLQTDVVAVLATGRCMPRMNYTAEEAEQEKILGGLALEGASLVSFDNVSSSRPFGGSPIERALTVTGKIKFRILGVSDVPALLWLCVLAGTGNNISFTPDAVRRVLVSRLKSLEARPEDRTDFKYVRLLEHVQENRARYVVAALTVLRAYVVAGRPDKGTGVWGSFESWASLVPQAIKFAGGANVLDARPAGDAASNPKDAAMVAFLSGMWRMRRNENGKMLDISGGAEFTSSELFEWFFTAGKLDEAQSPIRIALENLCTGKIASGKPIGIAIGGFRDRVFPCDDRGLHLQLVGRPVGGSQRWSLKRLKRPEENSR